MTLFCVLFSFFVLFFRRVRARAKRSVKLKAQQKAFGNVHPFRRVFIFSIWCFLFFVVVMCTHSFFLSVVFRSTLVFALFCVIWFGASASAKRADDYIIPIVRPKNFFLCFRYENWNCFFNRNACINLFLIWKVVYKTKSVTMTWKHEWNCVLNYSVYYL